MKKSYLKIGLIIALGISFSSCSKEEAELKQDGASLDHRAAITEMQEKQDKEIAANNEKQKKELEKVLSNIKISDLKVEEEQINYDKLENELKGNERELVSLDDDENPAKINGKIKGLKKYNITFSVENKGKDTLSFDVKLTGLTSAIDEYGEEIYQDEAGGIPFVQTTEDIEESEPLIGNNKSSVGTISYLEPKEKRIYKISVYNHDLIYGVDGAGVEGFYYGNAFISAKDFSIDVDIDEEKYVSEGPYNLYTTVEEAEESKVPHIIKAEDLDFKYDAVVNEVGEYYKTFEYTMRNTTDRYIKSLKVYNKPEVAFTEVYKEMSEKEANNIAPGKEGEISYSSHSKLGYERFNEEYFSKPFYATYIVDADKESSK